MLKTICLLAIVSGSLIFALSSCENRARNDLPEVNNNKVAQTGAHEPASNNTESTPDPLDRRENVPALVESVETLDMDLRRKAVARIEEIAKNDPFQRNQIINQLIGDVHQICVDQGRVIESETLFQKVGTMSMILSDLQSVEALDVLTDCSNHTRPAGTDGVNEFATMAAIINYKEKAVPALKMKLQQPANDVDDKLLKCSISSTLSAIGGKKAEQILVEAKKNETDEEVLSCMSRSLAGIRVHLKGM